MLRGIRGFYGRTAPVGDILGEMFYAVWMVVVSIGILNTVTTITDEHLAYVLYVAFSVNIGWGIIDGVTVMYTNIIERAEQDQIVYDLRADGGPEARGRALENLGDTIAASLSPAERERLLDTLAAGPAGENPAQRRYRAGPADWRYAFAIFSIDFLMVFPLIAPILLIPDVATGVYVSRLIATAVFAGLGAAYARHLNRNPMLAALALGTLGWSVFTIAFRTGW